jgi:hypothetical protein
MRIAYAPARCSAPCQHFDQVGRILTAQPGIRGAGVLLSPRLARVGGAVSIDSGGTRILVIQYCRRFAANRSILAERNTPFFSGKFKEIQSGFLARDGEGEALTRLRGEFPPSTEARNIPRHVRCLRLH